VVAGTPLSFDLTAAARSRARSATATPASRRGIRIVGTQNDAISAPDAPDAGRVVTRTDANGRFEQAGLANGRFSLSASGRGRGAARRQSVRVGSRVDLVLFPSGSVFGTVLGDDGRPVPGAVVSAAAQVGRRRHRARRRARRVRDPRPRPRAYDVVAHAPGLRPPSSPA
jgi:hypothetical protein